MFFTPNFQTDWRRHPHARVSDAHQSGTRKFSVGEFSIAVFFCPSYLRGPLLERGEQAVRLELNIIQVEQRL